VGLGVEFYVASTQYRSYGDFSALLAEEDLRCPSVHYFRQKGHLSSTTDLLSDSWLASTYKRFQSPCRDSNPQWRGTRC
jgi:hypothetical protein